MRCSSAVTAVVVRQRHLVEPFFRMLLGELLWVADLQLLDIVLHALFHGVADRSQCQGNVPELVSALLNQVIDVEGLAIDEVFLERPRNFPGLAGHSQVGVEEVVVRERKRKVSVRLRRCSAGFLLVFVWCHGVYCC